MQMAVSVIDQVGLLSSRNFFIMVSYTSLFLVSNDSFCSKILETYGAQLTFGFAVAPMSVRVVVVGGTAPWPCLVSMYTMVINHIVVREWELTA